MALKSIGLYMGLVVAAMLIPLTVHSQEAIVVAFSDFPPFKIGHPSQPGGIDVEILEQMAARMNRTLTFKRGSFEECLRMMQEGQADVMSSLLRRPEREKYIHYVQPRYRVRTDKVFFLLKKRGITLRIYDDLQKLKIGVKSEAQYAPMFDNDQSLEKIPADSLKLNITKLAAGQIDTFIATDLEGRYWIRELNLEDRIVKAPFKFSHLDPVYMGISKKSSFMEATKEFGRILKEMVDTGAIRKIEDRYLKP
ncbi:MAG: transporter substrate-binding domain-containing protein [Desulfobacterales bacterium]|jgi:polar amino acid transport system substrate-binding protein